MLSCLVRENQKVGFFMGKITDKLRTLGGCILNGLKRCGTTAFSGFKKLDHWLDRKFQSIDDHLCAKTIPHFRALQRWIARRIDDAMSMPVLSGSLRVYLWIIANLVTVYVTVLLTVIVAGVAMLIRSLMSNPLAFFRSLVEIRGEFVEIIWLDVVLSNAIIAVLGIVTTYIGIIIALFVTDLGHLAHSLLLPVEIRLGGRSSVDFVADFPWLTSALTAIIVIFRPEGLHQVFFKTFMVKTVFFFTLFNFGATLFVWYLSYCCHAQIERIKYYVLTDDYPSRDEFFRAGKEAKDRSEWPVQLFRRYLKPHHEIWERCPECRSCTSESENSAAPASAPANEQETPNGVVSLSPSKSQPKPTSSAAKPSVTSRRFVTFDLKNGN